MQFEVLGPVRLRRGGEAVPLSGRLRRVLFAMLVRYANEAVPAGMLQDALWGSRLVAGGYQLRVLPGESDIEQFELLLDEAADLAGTDPGQRAWLIRKALRVWRGTSYQDVDAQALAAEAHRLSERRPAAIKQLYAAELSDDHHAEIITALSAVVRQNPLRERLHGLLMTALYRAERQADALAVLRDA